MKLTDANWKSLWLGSSQLGSASSRRCPGTRSVAAVNVMPVDGYRSVSATGRKGCRVRARKERRCYRGWGYNRRGGISSGWGGATAKGGGATASF